MITRPCSVRFHLISSAESTIETPLIITSSCPTLAKDLFCEFVENRLCWRLANSSGSGTDGDSCRDDREADGGLLNGLFDRFGPTPAHGAEHRRYSYTSLNYTSLNDNNSIIDGKKSPCHSGAT
ncbi:hypothetical protein [Planctomycetes bacterium CA13]|uniref:hypothetical protein n=1 Tax=Novipirellula herctigrandis TaxID=2527986 RepID=UPI0011B4C27F